MSHLARTMHTRLPRVARAAAGAAPRRGFAQEHVFPGVNRMTELVVDRASGSKMWTVEGDEYLDCTSGIGVLSTGHCHPTVVAAVQEQAAKVTHAQQSIVYGDTTLKLMDDLAEIAPEGLDRFFFVNSGGEAVEAAMRLARQATGKDSIIAMLGGYHGRTTGTLAVTSSSVSYRGGRPGPLPGGTSWAPYPYPYAGTSSESALEALELVLKQQCAAGDTAAVLIEPILGEGGYVVPPPGYLRSLRSFCDQHDILLIADEVQCGMGRTGKWWAVDHTETKPDILITAKGLASGYPIAGIAARSELCENSLKNAFGGTYGGNCVAAAAARATIQVIKEEELLGNAVARGAQFVAGVESMGAEAALAGVVGEVRGEGLMLGVEFAPGCPGYDGLAGRVSKGCFERGMLLLVAGHRQTMRFAPALNITEAETDQALTIFRESLLDAVKSV